MDNIIIDFDNTIADSSRLAIEYIVDKYNLPKKEYDSKELCWNFAPYITDEKMQKEAVEYMGSEDFFRQLEPMPAAIESIIKIKKSISSSCELTLCTNRTGESFDRVKQWLKDYSIFGSFNHIICTSSFDKSIIRGDVIIDDKPACMIKDDRRYHIIFGDCRYTYDEFTKAFNALGSKAESYKFCNNWPEVVRAVSDPYRYFNEDF